MTTDQIAGREQPSVAAAPSLFPSHRRGAIGRLQWGGPWKGRGYVKIIWRQNKPTPMYLRLHRRNPVDHMKARLGPLEVWW